MSSWDYDYYLQKADEYETKAETENYPNIRAAYRKLAGEYRKLAGEGQQSRLDEVKLR